MKLDGCFSHKSDDWKTPEDIFKQFMRGGYIDCFPYFSKYDEFQNNYHNKKLFVNPPFSKMEQVVDWVSDQVKNNCTVALLIPARTDTRYFHKLLSKNKQIAKIYFIQGRLHYNESGTAPFPTILIMIGNDYKQQYEIISQEDIWRCLYEKI